MTITFFPHCIKWCIFIIFYTAALETLERQSKSCSSLLLCISGQSINVYKMVTLLNVSFSIFSHAFNFLPQIKCSSVLCKQFLKPSQSCIYSVFSPCFTLLGCVLASSFYLLYIQQVDCCNKMFLFYILECTTSETSTRWLCCNSAVFSMSFLYPFRSWNTVIKGWEVKIH